VVAAAPVTGGASVAVAIGGGVAGATLCNLADDPPDPNFREIATPVVPRLSQQPFAVGPDLTQAEATALNAYLDNLENSMALSRVMLTSGNRATGANKAGDLFWEARQMEAMRAYSAELAPLIRNTPQLSAALASALRAAGRPEVAVTPEDVKAFQDTVLLHGLPTAWESELTQLGADSLEREKLKAKLLFLKPWDLMEDLNPTVSPQSTVATMPASTAAIPDEDVSSWTFTSLLTDPRFAMGFEQAAQALEAFASEGPTKSAKMRVYMPLIQR